MNFATRMKQLKLENNITTKELADKLKVARTTVSNWENGNRNPDFDTLKRIAKIFNTTTDYLLGGRDTRKMDEQQSKNHPLLEKIENLSPESQKELEKYLELLKIKEQMDKSKDETSSALERDA